MSIEAFSNELLYCKLKERIEKQAEKLRELECLARECHFDEIAMKARDYRLGLEWLYAEIKTL